MFCSIAAGAIGITSFRDFAVYTALGWLYKTAVEVVMLPITYRVIAVHQAPGADLPARGLTPREPPMIHDYGDQALLLDFDGTAEVLAWCDAVREADLPGVLDVVPAARTVLLDARGPATSGADREPASAGCASSAPTIDAGRPVGRPTSPSTSSTTARTSTRWRALTGLSPDEVVAAHTAAPMRVGFGGFAPGFAYLVGGDERLHVPRRAEPRTKVPAGSVGLAGEFSGVYPRETPGGWQLIGRTDAVLWDVDRDPPALLVPGTWVQFRAIGGPAMTTLEILATGPLALLEDLGRPGLRAPGRHPLRRRRPALPHPGQPAGGQPARPRHHRGHVRRVLRPRPRRRRRRSP